MSIFRKPTIADIYVKQLRTRLDRSFVPVYPPDVPNIRVGTIGRFVDGEFQSRGHIADVIGGEKELRRKVKMARPSEPATFSFHSAGHVELHPSAKVSVAGQELLKSKLSFTGNRAVVASFVGVVSRTVGSPRDFDALLWSLYLGGDLARDEVVVWLHRSAASGTVLVNIKGGIDVEVFADPALVGAAISFEGLGAGVQFGVGSQASAQTSGTGLTLAVKAKGLGSEEATQLADVRGFDAGPEDDVLAAFEGSPIPSVDAEDVIAEADFDIPDE